MLIVTFALSCVEEFARSVGPGTWTILEQDGLNHLDCDAMRSMSIKWH